MTSDDCDLWIYPTKTYIKLGKEKNVRSLKEDLTKNQISNYKKWRKN